MQGSSILEEVAPLVRAGVAVHWLRPRSKAPLNESGWSTAPVASLADLRTTYQEGANVGVRPGEFSRVGDLYLHLIDLDIRRPEMVEAAWSALLARLPGARDLPFVISGSGGESRHLYFLTDQPFRSRKLVVSPGFDMVPDPKTGKDVKKRHWEIELFGTGKQAALPPSIHPDTGLPYRWGRTIDLDLVEMGAGPVLSAAQMQDLGARDERPPTDEDLVSLTRTNPLGLSLEDAQSILDDLPIEAWCEDRDGWLNAGMALHHEFDGSDDAFEMWNAFSRKSAKFNPKDQRTVWESFKGRGKPVRMATLVKAARLARLERVMDEAFEESDDGMDGQAEPMPKPGSPDDIDDLEPRIEGGAVDWRSKLDLTDKGAIKGTLHNVELIIQHDPRTGGVPRMNEFTGEIVQLGGPGLKEGRTPKGIKQLGGAIWKLKDDINGDLWSDAKDNAVRSIMEAPFRQGGYGFKVTDRDLKAAINLCAHEKAFHPVRDYLNSMAWDGVERMETLFVRHLGAPDTPYSRAVARLMLLGAVTRVYEPGHKFDFVVILEGVQGKRKSTFISVLARHWFAELQGDFADRKRMIEKMQGSWVLEIPELSGFSKAEVNDIKAFLSSLSDKDRLAYERRATVFHRQCIFVGSTNDREYLRDATGGRRFWPVECTVVEIDTEALELEIDQVWAEAVAAYRAMREKQPRGTLPLYLANDIAKTIAADLQESRRVETAEDGIAGKLSVWLDQPLNDDSGFDEDGVAPLHRDQVCLLEIWIECLRRDASQYVARETSLLRRAMERVPGWEPVIGPRRTAKYGNQRVFRRINPMAPSAATAAYMDVADIL